MKHRATKNPQPTSSAEKEPTSSWANAEAKIKFETETLNRNLHPEKGFKYGKVPNFGLVGEVVEFIEAHSWKRFVEHPLFLYSVGEGVLREYQF